MSNLLHNRLFRFLVCLLVICCMLVNLSPIRAKAIAMGGAEVFGLGLIALLYLILCGFIMPPDVTSSYVEDVGDAVRKYCVDNMVFEIPEWPDDADDEEDDLNKQLEEIKEAGEEAGDKVVKVGDNLIKAIKAFILGAFTKGGFDLVGDTAPEGYAYYNGVLLPIFTDDIRNHADSGYGVSIFYYGGISNPTYRLVLSNAPFIYGDSESALYKNYVYMGDTSTYTKTVIYHISSDTWVSDTVSFNDHQPIQSISPPLEDVFYSSVGVSRFSDGSLYVPASEPTTTKTTTLTPSTYVGDIPQQIQDGTITQDNLELPQYIDLYEIFGSTLDETAQNYNQVVQQLQTGERNYDDFVQSVTAADPSFGDNDGSDIGTDTGIGSDTGTDTEWQPPEDPGEFALDLSNVFPFCITFDLYDFLTCLNADPVAPVIQWELALPGGGSYPIELDLSPFDSVAQLLRRLQLLLFCVALAIKTRDLIKG